VRGAGYREKGARRKTHSSGDDVTQGKGRRTMRRLLVLVAAGLIAATLIALVSGGGASARSKNYTAIALSTSTVTTASGDASSLNGAENKAWRRCDSIAYQGYPDLYENDCEIAIWVKNGWAAVAFERSIEGPPYAPSWGSGYGRTRPSARSYAVQGCEQGAQEPCDVYQTERTLSFNPSLPTSGG
jgi:hypothetical protein